MERPWDVWLEGNWVGGRKGRERKEKRNCRESGEKQNALSTEIVESTEKQNEEMILRQKGMIIVVFYESDKHI